MNSNIIVQSQNCCEDMLHAVVHSHLLALETQCFILSFPAWGCVCVTLVSTWSSTCLHCRKYVRDSSMPLQNPSKLHLLLTTVLSVADASVFDTQHGSVEACSSSSSMTASRLTFKARLIFTSQRQPHDSAVRLEDTHRWMGKGCSRPICQRGQNLLAMISVLSGSKDHAVLATPLQVSCIMPLYDTMKPHTSSPSTTLLSHDLLALSHQV